MEVVPLLSSEIVGDLANTAQLTGLDAVKIIALIVRVASNPQILRRRCRQFARHVKVIGDLLEELNIKEMTEYQETRNPLNRLEEVLKKSYVLVKQCQERCYLKLLLKGWSISHKLKQAQAEIDEYLKIIPLMVLKEIRRLREHCVNAREDDESKRKLAAHTAAISIFMFKQLLDEASEDITEKTNYEYFAKKWGQDERFEALDRSKRESLLNERVLSLRQDLQEKGKTRQATPIASFKAMLSDSGDINSNSEWSKDGHEHRRNEDLDRAIALSLIEEEQREDGHEHSGNEDLDRTIALSLNEEKQREDGHEHSGNEDLDLAEDLDRAIALSLCEEEQREVNNRGESSQARATKALTISMPLAISSLDEIDRAMEASFDEINRDMDALLENFL